MRTLPSASVTGFLAAAVAFAAGAHAAAVEDPRSLELLRFDCTTGVVRSEVTLFANGTLRLREGDVGEEAMQLAELAPDVREGYLRRLQQESLGGDLAPPPGVDGLWTEQCVLTLDVPDGPAGTASVGAFDSMSLPLSRLVTIARELVALARVQTYVAGIPTGYVPREGDVLIHHDGSRYLIQGWTSDGRGIEVVGLDQPLTIYVAVEELSQQFLSVETSQ